MARTVPTLCVCVCVCVCACVCVCVYECTCVRVHVCARVLILAVSTLSYPLEGIPAGDSQLHKII